MHNAENKVLVSDICARLPYGIKGKVGIEVSSGNYSVGSGHLEFNDVDVDVELLGYLDGDIVVQPIDEEYNEVISNNNFDMDDFVPYLRSISSMTEDEKKKYALFYRAFSCSLYERESVERVDWLNAHHFDYRGLIEKGLALEAPEDMYKDKNV